MRGITSITLDYTASRKMKRWKTTVLSSPARPLRPTAQHIHFYNTLVNHKEVNEILKLDLVNQIQKRWNHRAEKDEL